MKWVQIGYQKQDGLNRRTYAAEVPNVGVVILVNSEKFEHSTFVPGVRLEGEKLVPIPPPQDDISYGLSDGLGTP